MSHKKLGAVGQWYWESNRALHCWILPTQPFLSTLIKDLEQVTEDRIVLDVEGVFGLDTRTIGGRGQRRCLLLRLPQLEAFS